MIDHSDQLEINALMSRYFDGLYHCSSSTLRTVFHHELLYTNANPGQKEFLRLEAYMQRIDERTSPESLNESRSAEIVEIALKGTQIAVVVARSTMLGRDYHDVLTLIRSEDGWRVLNKVFTYIELED